jgi:hypothetical protein
MRRGPAPAGQPSQVAHVDAEHSHRTALLADAAARAEAVASVVAGHLVGRVDLDDEQLSWSLGRLVERLTYDLHLLLAAERDRLPNDIPPGSLLHRLRRNADGALIARCGYVGRRLATPEEIAAGPPRCSECERLRGEP